ncbi:MAG: hypothetical protein JW751_27325 [Polyangiaceae bacterium]|nr:hypothetical protein [Polyangiaceae bacterium]
MVTLLHGIVDAPTLAFCVARTVEGEVIPMGSPFPDRGLPFAGAVALGELPGLDVAAEDATLYVIAGTPEVLAELDCASAIRRAAELARANGGAGGSAGGTTAGAGGGAGTPPLVARAGAGGDLGMSGDGGDVAVGAAGALGESGTRGNAGAAAPGAAGIRGAGGVAGATGAGGAAGISGAAGAAAGAGGAGLRSRPPPELRAAALATIPEGTLARERSTLLVARGCLGGGYVPGADLESICGAGGTSSGFTASPLFVRLSRLTAPDSVGLTAVHAATPVAADERLSVALTLDGSTPIELVTGLLPGSIALPPVFVPNVDFSAMVLGGAVSVGAGRAPTATVSVSWSEILARTDDGAPRAGGVVALVIVGPGLGVELGMGPWNPPTVGLVDAAPALQ